MEAHVNRFSDYFAFLRERQGSGLREFCADHRFDPGNVSRLEAGKVPPPRSPKVLARYAEALGLKPGSPEWDRFVDLAAAERGELPPDLRSDERVISRLPDVFRILRQEAAGTVNA
jgi:transcriptional regulator with XRE-family HTH domain